MQAYGFQVMSENPNKEIPGASKSENPRPVICVDHLLVVTDICGDT